jgi:hypothetical protein
VREKILNHRARPRRGVRRHRAQQSSFTASGHVDSFLDTKLPLMWTPIHAVSARRDTPVFPKGKKLRADLRQNRKAPMADWLLNTARRRLPTVE